MICCSWSHFRVEHLNNVTVKFQLEQFFGVLLDESAISFSFKPPFLEFLDGEGFMSQAFLRCCYNTSKHPNRITKKKSNTQKSNKHTPIVEDVLLSNVPFLSFFCLFSDFSLGWTSIVRFLSSWGHCKQQLRAKLITIQQARPKMQSGS